MGWISTDRGKLMVKFSFHIIVMFHKTRSGFVQNDEKVRIIYRYKYSP